MESDLGVLERLMRARRSERHFLPQDIDATIIERLVTLACTAPSAGNRQPFRIMAVRRPSTRQRMVELVSRVTQDRLRSARTDVLIEAEQHSRDFLHFGAAPVVLVFLFRAQSPASNVLGVGADDDELAECRDALSSAAAAIMQLLLAAHAMGLGACWMTGPTLAEPDLLALLRIPAGWRLAALVPVGYVSKPSPARRRKPTRQMQFREPEDELDRGQS